MSEGSAIYALVHKRFREVFGEPSSVLGRDDHWSLRLSHPHAASINLLVNGTDKVPACWVFDPHILNDGVMRVAIEDEATLNSTINTILERVKRANEKHAAN